MLKIIATDDFINFLEEIPIKHLSLLDNLFMSIEKVSEDEVSKNDKCIKDLLEQLRNQELE